MKIFGSTTFLPLVFKLATVAGIVLGILAIAGRCG